MSKNLQELFSESDIEGTFIVPSLDVRAQVLNIYDRRNGDGKHVFKLAPPGHDQMFAITAPRVCVSLIFLMMSCDKSYVKQAHWLRIARPMCDGHTFASSPFRRLASRGSFFFCGVTLWRFFFELRSICADVWPFRPSIEKVYSTLRLAFSILPNGLVNVDFSSTTRRN